MGYRKKASRQRRKEGEGALRAVLSKWSLPDKLWVDRSRKWDAMADIVVRDGRPITPALVRHAIQRVSEGDVGSTPTVAGTVDASAAPSVAQYVTMPLQGLVAGEHPQPPFLPWPTENPLHSSHGTFLVRYSPRA